MRTVDNRNGETAIPIVTKTYLTKNRLAKIWTDLIYHGELNINSKKSKIIKKVRTHLWWQGITTYTDWYEDTGETEKINDIYKEVCLKITSVFPELQ